MEEVFVKADVEASEEGSASRSPSPSPAPLLSVARPVSMIAVAGHKRGVGRLVDSTQADDRRMIHLVRERPLLYARTNMPVASYQAQVKKLWREVADIMGWTVADVRRKWSHVRNSYSRHLRNEIHGVRTGRGRHVSRWYLADELEFLREHMATDTRASPLVPYSLVTPAFQNSFLKVEPEPPAEPPSWYASPAPAGAGGSEAGVSEPDSEGDETEAYFQFFRAIYKDYRLLRGRQQRAFRRQCLDLLHRLVDAAEDSAPLAPAAPAAPSAPVDLSRDTDPDSCPD